MTKTKLDNNYLSEFLSLILDERVSLISKSLLILAVGGYALFPLDVIPDILLPFGVVDDIGIIILAVRTFVSNAHQQIERFNMMSNSDGNFSQIKAQNSSGCVTAMLGCVAIIGALTLMILTGIVVLLISGTMTMNGMLASVGNFFNAPTTASVIPSRTIVSSLQPLGQLVSVSVEVAQADINVAVDTGGLNLCSHDANHVAQGVVEAGVDITQVEDTNIVYDEEANRYTVTLPSPQITSCRIEYIRQYERQGGNPTCGIDWDNVRLLAQYESTRLFAQDTLDAGILSRAERETTLLMEAFISALTGSEVEIEYLESSDVTLPASCQPQLPRGWILDEETQSWMQVE